MLERIQSSSFVKLLQTAKLSAHVSSSAKYDNTCAQTVPFIALRHNYLSGEAQKMVNFFKSQQKYR